MRVLVTGAKGQLGSDLLCELSKRNIESVGIDIEDLDITDAAATKKLIEDINNKTKLDAIIHCAAYTAVDAAEDNEALVTKINAEGTKNIAEVAKTLDVAMMYISTDYVFDGEGKRPWEPDDKRAPLNVYGMAKYKGELYVEELVKKYFIVRISWVFGLHGNNFIKTMLRLGKERGAVSVVNDQIGSPTYTPDLSRLLADMIVTDKYGRYHATNEGLCSWYDFAVEIFKQANLDVAVTPVSSDAFPVKAKRPHNSRMDKSKLTENGFKLLPTWQDALGRYLLELGEK
ncbi:MAG: dTDP-4-dehydrorhamnose reductase [Lachnospiraceae bacterium]|nr:MAG: dTDP-4-dehydrorhamnose reductase [Lachnospiraceae bacterium]